MKLAFSDTTTNAQKIVLLTRRESRGNSLSLERQCIITSMAAKAVIMKIYHLFYFQEESQNLVYF